MSYEIPPGQRTDNPTLDQACAMAYEFAVENEKIGRHTFTMRQLNQLANLYKVEDYSEIAHDDRTAIGQEFADYLDSAIVEQEIITPSLAQQSKDHAAAIIVASLQYNDPNKEDTYAKDFVVQCILTDLMHYCEAQHIDFSATLDDAQSDYQSERKDFQ